MKHLLLLTAFGLTLTACDSDDTDDRAATQVTISPTSADGSDVRGTITFTDTDGSDAVRVTGTITGLTPGDHGFHLHRDPTCDDADSDDDGALEPAGAAGPHWDPLGTNNHAGPDTPFDERHAGDMGNITAGSDGTARVDLVADGLSVDGQYSVRGHALMVHSDRDDLETDPGGNSGTRVGCGVVG